MRVVFHIGAHNTDQERLVRSLLKNRDLLQNRNIVVPGPGRYRKVLRDVVNRLRGEPADEAAQAALLEAITETDEVATLFLSNESFICVPERVLDDGRLYARAFKTAWLRNCFPDADVDFAIGLRDPATFLPALFRGRSNADLDFEDYLTGVDPFALRWSDTIAEIRQHNPDSRILVWCNEDTPLIWPDILAEVTGLPADQSFEGAFDIAEQLLTPEGVATLHAYLEKYPPETPDERRRLVTVILQQYAVAGSLEEEIDLPGWDDTVLEELTDLYDSDMARIAATPGVTFIAP